MRTDFRETLCRLGLRWPLKLSGDSEGLSPTTITRLAERVGFDPHPLRQTTFAWAHGLIVKAGRYSPLSNKASESVPHSTFI